LTVSGDRACGYVNGKPVLGIADLKGKVPAGGRAGISAKGARAAFDDLSVRGGALSGDALPLDVPEGASAAALPGGFARLKECGGRYVFLKGVKSLRGDLRVEVRFKELESYAQFAVCGAAAGPRGPMAAQMVDFESEKSAILRLLGILPYRGQLRTARYGASRSDGIDLSEPIELRLRLAGGSVECWFDGERAARYTGGAAPLPSDPGRWGFRSTDLTTEIQRLELEL
jgi:hypothetical protein